MFQVDQSDSPRWPDDLVVQDTNLMHLPSTVFTFNKPDGGREERQSVSEPRGKTNDSWHQWASACRCRKTRHRENQSCWAKKTLNFFYSRWSFLSIKVEVQPAGGAGERVPTRVDQLQKSKHAFLSNTCFKPRVGVWKKPLGMRSSSSTSARVFESQGLNLTHGSGSSTSFFLRSNWSFDILLKTSPRGETTRNNC